MGGILKLILWVVGIGILLAVLLVFGLLDAIF